MASFWRLHCQFEFLVPKLLYLKWHLQTILKDLLILGLWTWVQWLKEMKGNKIKWYGWSLISDKANYNSLFLWTQLENTRRFLVTDFVPMFPYIYIISHIIQQLLQNNESIETKGNIGSRFVRHKTSMVALDTYGIIHLVSTQNFSKD